MSKNPWSILKNILTYILFILFLYTAITKLIDIETFFHELARSPLLPSNFSTLIGSTVIFVEVVLCGMLLFEKTNRIGILLSGGLLLVFTVYITMILLYSPYVPCSCGGIISELGWTAHLILNISLALGCFIVISNVPLNFNKNGEQR